jgi:hypothetical protein
LRFADGGYAGGVGDGNGSIALIAVGALGLCIMYAVFTVTGWWVPALAGWFTLALLVGCIAQIFRWLGRRRRAAARADHEGPLMREPYS